MTTLRVTSFFSRAIAVLAALTLSFGMASAAQAHSVLLGSDPDDGAQLAVAPDSVSLRFNEDITELGTEIVITVGDEDTVVSTGDVEIKGSTISQALVDARPEGLYTVTWRAVSADGHPISGVFTFTAASATEPEAAPAETPDEAPAETPEAENTEEPEVPTTEDDSDAAADADSGESQGLSASTWVIIGVLVVAAAILATMIGRSLAASRRSDHSE